MNVPRVEPIRVRDVVRGELYELGGNELALRVAYDMFHPVGAVHVSGHHAEWFEGEAVRTSRVVPTALREARAGERVLLRLDAADDEWWLCDVESTGVKDS